MSNTDQDADTSIVSMVIVPWLVFDPVFFICIKILFYVFLQFSECNNGADIYSRHIVDNCFMCTQRDRYLWESDIEEGRHSRLAELLQ